MEYNEEEFLQLSGIQHYFFCRRQWALIHIEGLWAENERPVDGEFVHKHAHDSASREKRGDILIVRGMYIHSRELGFSGQCDIVEFHECPEGISIIGEEGRWIPFPVEYKRGKEKPGDCDLAQVCAQAICLEEMYYCPVVNGAIYYGERRHRMDVAFSEKLRTSVKQASLEMHSLMKRGYTPKGRRRKSCDFCSLQEKCLPALMEHESTAEYLKRMEDMEER